MVGPSNRPKTEAGASPRLLEGRLCRSVGAVPRPSPPRSPPGVLSKYAGACVALDGGGWIVCAAGKSADRQKPNAVRTRQDLAPRRRPDPDDVLCVQLIPVAVDLHVGRTAQCDIDLFLAELVGGRIPGSVGRVVGLRVGG